MFIAHLHYQRPIDVINSHVQAHRDYLDTLYATGKLIVSGRKADQTGGVIVFATSDRSEVEAIIAKDPFHSLDLATYELIEFDPAKYDPKFADIYL
ncbi:YciI family protein [Shimazuella sp. AN120528]|uniref:YciI family protein n=1 Tax=Shimazuella soli TaxID=1892854 RepID=UPI001F1025AA|nr:YciI family protein [Shimazuella soli]MCH5585902.1 YciI family protein [Shimazuella soli]